MVPGGFSGTTTYEHKRLWRRARVSTAKFVVFQKEGMWRLLPETWHKCATASFFPFLDTPTVQMGNSYGTEPRTEPESAVSEAKNSREQRKEGVEGTGLPDPNRRYSRR